MIVFMTSDVAAWMTGAGLLVDGGAAKGNVTQMGSAYRPLRRRRAASLSGLRAEGAQVGGNMCR
jgi:hypothetical protein